MKRTIIIEGMSCSHCTAAVKKALEEIKGVKAAEVNLEQKSAFVEASESVTEDMLRTAVEDAGFDVI